MKKLFILCVVLVASIHVKSRSVELDKDSEDYDSDEDSSVPHNVVEDMEAQHQQEVENGGEDNEVLSFFTKEYDQVVDDCRVETGYTNEVVAKEKASYFSENRGLRIFNYCFLEKTGVVTRDGKLNIDKFPAKVTSSFPETFKNCFARGKKYPIVNACRKETGYTDEVIAEEEKGEEEEGPGLKKFNDCFLEKTGFEADEKYDIDIALVHIPKSNVTKIIEICKSVITKKIIPESVPFLSACLHLGLSNYYRQTDTVKLLPETDHVTQIVDVCGMETGFTKNYFTEEDSLRKFNNCFLEKTGVITSDGKLNIDAALAKLPPSFAKPIIEHCQANIILKYTTDSVHDFSNCYYNGVQNQISLELINPFSVSLQLVIPGTSFSKKYPMLIPDINYVCSKFDTNPISSFCMKE